MNTSNRATIHPLFPKIAFFSGPKFPSGSIFKFVEMSGIFNIYHFFTLPPILKVQKYKKLRFIGIYIYKYIYIFIYKYIYLFINIYIYL